MPVVPVLTMKTMKTFVVRVLVLAAVFAAGRASAGYGVTLTVREGSVVAFEDRR